MLPELALFKVSDDEVDSASKFRGIHLNRDGVAQKCAYQRRHAVKLVGAYDTNVRQAVDLLRPDRQRDSGWIDAHGEVGSSLLGSGDPAGVGRVGGAVSTCLTRRIADDGVGEDCAAHVECAEDQQHKDGDCQRELHQRLATPTRARSRHPLGAYQQDRGQILVVFAIMATAMLAVIGLLYSFGVILSQRRALQSAADAASLAGAWQVLQELASDNRSDANVLSIIDTYASRNGVSAANVAALYVDSAGTQLTAVGAGGQFPVTARGVRVSVNGTVSTILPGFLNVFSVLVRDSATATSRPTVPPATEPIIPIAISVSAYSAHATYDLFAGQTLNLLPGAPDYGAPSINEQYWSDGQHLGSWQLNQPGNVSVADGPYHDSIAAGLHDNVRRQALTDASGNAYASVMVPVYDSSTPTSVHVVGFVQVKILGSAVSPSTAPGLFVPYAAAAYGTPTVPSRDLGATLPGIIS